MNEYCQPEVSNYLWTIGGLISFMASTPFDSNTFSSVAINFRHLVVDKIKLSGYKVELLGISSANSFCWPHAECST